MKKTSIQKIRQSIAQNFFYLGTFLYVFYYFIYVCFYWYIENDPTKQIPIQRVFYIGVLCILIKIVLTQYQRIELAIGVLGAVLMYICWKASGGIDFPVNFLILFAMKDVELKKSMKAVFCGGFIPLCYGMTWFFRNAPDKLTRIKNYGRGLVETRYKFCTWHANMFQTVIFLLILSFLCAYYKKIKWWGYLLLFYFNYKCFTLTGSRTAALCAALAIIGFAVLRYLKPLFDRWVVIVVFQIGNVIGIGLSIYYGLFANTASSNFIALDQFITGRLTVARSCFLESGIHLFGSNIGGKVCGYGIYTQANPGYVTELGIVRVLLEYGPIIFGLFCLAVFAAMIILQKSGHYGTMILLEIGFIVSGIEASFPAAFNLRAFAFGVAFFELFQIFKKKKEKRGKRINEEAV